MNVYKPIFIIGSARSGTTLLYNILSKHRELAYVNRNIIITRVYTNFVYTYKGKILSTIDKDRKIRILLARLFNKLYKDRWHQEPQEADHLFARYMGTYKYVTEDDYRKEMDMLREDIYAIQKVFDRHRFINKNPHHAFRVRLLNRIFQDAKFINIIRDGRAVAYSLYKFEKTTPNAVAQNLENILCDKYNPNKSRLYNYGLAWQVIVNKAREIRYLENENRYLEIRYEDLISNPHDVISKIIKFCELKWYEEFSSAIPKMRNENIKWRALPENNKKELEDATYELRSILGYD